MLTVTLTHKCNRPGLVGDVGDVINCTDEQAKDLIDRGGAKPTRAAETATLRGAETATLRGGAEKPRKPSEDPASK
jgi:hypothetical protein